MTAGPPRKTSDPRWYRFAAVVALAAERIGIPSVSNCPDERLDEVACCARFVAGWLREAGLEMRRPVV